MTDRIPELGGFTTNITFQNKFSLTKVEIYNNIYYHSIAGINKVVQPFTETWRDFYLNGVSHVFTPTGILCEGTMTKKMTSITGQELREMFAASTAWLEKNAADIDSLNVFPVPDGDTGTNMLLTMRSSIEEAYRAPDHSASGVAQALAKGALMGARGNSGVILSQIMRGLAQEVTNKDVITGADLARALVQASKTAYKGLSNPTEGTILTVIKDASNAAVKTKGKNGKDVISVMEMTVNTARESVANTPTLLPVLKEAGVVDAGGQGLYTIFEGALHYLKGETEQMQFRKPQVITSTIPLTLRLPEMIAADEVPYGYCTEMMIKGEELDTEKIRTRLEKKGESLIVVGDNNTVRLHVHT
jgi:DAK2 domain fusion protein YloV